MLFNCFYGISNFPGKLERAQPGILAIAYSPCGSPRRSYSLFCHPHISKCFLISFRNVQKTCVNACIDLCFYYFQGISNFPGKLERARPGIVAIACSPWGSPRRSCSLSCHPQPCTARCLRRSYSLFCHQQLGPQFGSIGIFIVSASRSPPGLSRWTRVLTGGEFLATIVIS